MFFDVIMTMSFKKFFAFTNYVHLKQLVGLGVYREIARHKGTFGYVRFVSRKISIRLLSLARIVK